MCSQTHTEGGRSCSKREKVQHRKTKEMLMLDITIIIRLESRHVRAATCVVQRNP
jgi:hypothetical protein